MTSAAAIEPSMPAVSSGMIQQVADQLADRGLSALFIGPMTGVPYKIYAVQAGQTAVNPALFLLITLPGEHCTWPFGRGSTPGISHIMAFERDSR